MSSAPAARPARRVRPMATAVVAIALLAGALASTASPAGSIVGGDIARIKGHPHQVALLSPNGSQFCGGSIIGRSTIVTAAHCVEQTRPAGLIVQAGSAHLFRGRVQIRGVARIIRHPRYAREQVGDIAVLHLRSPLRFNRKVRPIALATAADVAAASHATVTGWGARFEENQRGSNRLLRARVPLVDDATCNAVLGEQRAGILPRLELCAGEPGSDTCYGDSGGPLIVSTPDGPRLAGITSWGLEPCGGSTPGIYAEVSSLAPWVEARSIG